MILIPRLGKSYTANPFGIPIGDVRSVISYSITAPANYYLFKQDNWNGAVRYIADSVEPFISVYVDGIYRGRLTHDPTSLVASLFTGYGYLKSFSTGMWYFSFSDIQAVPKPTDEFWFDYGGTFGQKIALTPSIEGLPTIQLCRQYQSMWQKTTGSTDFGTYTSVAGDRVFTSGGTFNLGSKSYTLTGSVSGVVRESYDSIIGQSVFESYSGTEATISYNSTTSKWILTSGEINYQSNNKPTKTTPATFTELNPPSTARTVTATFDSYVESGDSSLIYTSQVALWK